MRTLMATTKTKRALTIVDAFLVSISSAARERAILFDCGLLLGGPAHDAGDDVDGREGGVLRF